MKYLAPAAFIAVCLASTTAFAGSSACDAVTGNAVASVVVAKWEGVLGERPVDES